MFLSGVWKKEGNTWMLLFPCFAPLMGQKKRRYCRFKPIKPSRISLNLMENANSVCNVVTGSSMFSPLRHGGHYHSMLTTHLCMLFHFSSGTQRSQILFWEFSDFFGRRPAAERLQDWLKFRARAGSVQVGTKVGLFTTSNPDWSIAWSLQHFFSS